MGKTYILGNMEFMFHVEVVGHNGHVIIHSVDDDGTNGRIDRHNSKRIYIDYTTYDAALSWLGEFYPNLWEDELRDILEPLDSPDDDDGDYSGYDYNWDGKGLLVKVPNGSVYLQGDEGAELYDYLENLESMHQIARTLAQYEHVAE